MTEGNGNVERYRRDPAAHPGAAASASPYAGRVAPRRLASPATASPSVVPPMLLMT